MTGTLLQLHTVLQQTGKGNCKIDQSKCYSYSGRLPSMIYPDVIYLNLIKLRL